MRVIFTHRYFWPDTPPYGSLLRAIATAMARRGRAVEVFASRPSYGNVGISAPRREWRDGVAIHRCWTFQEDKSRPLVRLVNVAIYCTFLFFRVLRSRAHVVTAASFPPILAGWTASFAAQLSGKQFIYHLQDIHPELSAVSGGAMGRGPLFRFARWLDQQTLKRASRVVVLSDDMAKTLLKRPEPVTADKIAIINNFQVEPDCQHTDFRHPGMLKRPGQIRAIYAGNLGKFQQLDLFVDAARILESIHPEVEIVFLGGGAEEKALERRAAGLSNICFYRFLPIDQARHVIADADIGLVSLRPGITRVSYPSKTFTYLGLGLPLLLVAEAESDLGFDMRSRRLAVVPATRTPEDIAKSLIRFAADRTILASKNDIIALYQREFGFRRRMTQWNELINGLAL